MSDAPIFDEPPVGQPDAESPAPGGYVSREAKSQYGLTVAVALGVAVFLQMVLPNVYIHTRFPGLMFGALELQMADLERSTFWNGRLWFAEETFSNQRRPATGIVTRLESVSLQTGRRSEPGIEITMHDPWLLPARNRLWLVSADVVGWVEGRRVRTTVPTLHPGNMSRPFLFRDTPAVVEFLEDGAHLLQFIDGDWQEHTALRLPGERTAPFDRDFRMQGFGPPVQTSAPQKVEVVTVGETPYFFVESTGTLYVHTGVPAERQDGDERDEELGGWEKVGDAGDRSWQVVALDGDPVVVVGAGERPLLRLQALRRGHHGRWMPFFESETIAATEWGVFALEQPGRFAVAAQLMPGMTRILQVERDRVVDTLRVGGVYEFLENELLPTIVVFQLLMLAPPILAIAVIGWMMFRCRTSEFAAGDRSVRLASLPRRAIARTIDTLLRSLPSFFALFLVLDLDVDRWIVHVFEQPRQAATILGVWMGVGCGWWLLLALLFCITEGRWGLTPGKWLAGIRVVNLDLAVCGFWRALVRNLLMIVDGFYNYLVGIGLIAFLRDRQRLGDMAVGTIVIRATPENLASGGSRT